MYIYVNKSIYVYIYEVEAQPRPPQKCNSRLRRKTALTIVLVKRALKKSISAARASLATKFVYATFSCSFNYHRVL